MHCFHSCLLIMNCSCAPHWTPQLWRSLRATFSMGLKVALSQNVPDDPLTCMPCPASNQTLCCPSHDYGAWKRRLEQLLNAQRLFWVMYFGRRLRPHEASASPVLLLFAREDLWTKSLQCRPTVPTVNLSSEFRLGAYHKDCWNKETNRVTCGKFTKAIPSIVRSPSPPLIEQMTYSHVVSPFLQWEDDIHCSVFPTSVFNLVC